MNRILVDKNKKAAINIASKTLLIVKDNTTLNLNINILANTELYLLILSNKESLKITFNLNNYQVLLKNYLEVNDINIVYNFNLKKQANLVYKSSAMIIDKVELLYNVNHLENASSSLIENTYVTKDMGKMILDIEVNVANNLKQVNSYQDSKIIKLNNELSLIKPNMSIFTQDCLVDHSSYIGPLNLEEVFYLQSKGFSSKKAQEILVDSKVIAAFTEEELELFRKEVKNEC